MFKCQVTGKISKPREKMNRIVIATRDKVYTKKILEDGELVELEIGRGYEIVKEIAATDEGLRIYNQMVDDGTVASFIRNLR
jgi:deoxyribose-phosphate aldolase